MLTAAAHRFGKPVVGCLGAAAADPLSVRLALDAVTSQLGRLDLLIHVAPHELAATSRGVDPGTEAMAA